MKNSTTILSTKILSKPQKELLLNTGIGLIEYTAITIELLPVTVENQIQNAIFTSKNAVKAVFQNEMKIANCFCVGENTKKLLEAKGQNVLETAQNASDLAHCIVEKYQKDTFEFFCGNLRRDDLPDILKKHNIRCEETVVYKTHLNPKNFNRFFDGVLFFSPSGIQSFVSKNQIGNSTSFCIGNTTASEAKKYTDTIVVANKPTVENVIVQAAKYFKKE